MAVITTCGGLLWNLAHLSYLPLEWGWDQHGGNIFSTTYYTTYSMPHKMCYKSYTILLQCFVLSWLHQTSNISHTLIGKKIVDPSDVVGLLPVFILDLTHGFNGLGKDNCQTRYSCLDSCLLSAKPLSELVLDYCQLHTLRQISVKFELKYNNFHTRKLILSCYAVNSFEFAWEKLHKPFSLSAVFPAQWEHTSALYTSNDIMNKIDEQEIQGLNCKQKSHRRLTWRLCSCHIL